MLVYPYRCHQCDRRFWRFGQRQRSRALAVRVVAALVLVAAVIGAVWWSQQ